MEAYKQLYQMTVDASEITQLEGVPGSSLVNLPQCLSPEYAFARTYMNILQKWTKAFDAFIASREGSFTDHEMRSIRILRMHQLDNQIAIEVSTRHMIPADQMFWDDYCPLYEQIINLSEEILMSELSQTANSANRSPSFSLSPATIGPLFELARRCRDPRIRRKAVELMRSCHRREGMWDSKLALLVIERVIAIEEDGVAVRSCQDVPNWRRIFNIQHVLDMEGRTILLKYERQASATRYTTVQMQEVISW